MHSLEEKIGYRFKSISLLKNALAHSSYANEKKGRHHKPGDPVGSNERLEFLGDAVLSVVTADYIYRNYPAMPEGNLTKLRATVVCEQALHRQALKMGLAEHLLLGKGEEAGGGRERPSILADAVEAVIGAIYLDGGMEPARKFILSFTEENVREAVRHSVSNDYKTILQEIVQKNKQETLSYRTVSSTGPDHDKQFAVELLLNSNVFATGEGHSKKAAEQAAAREALRLMGEEV